MNWVGIKNKRVNIGFIGIKIYMVKITKQINKIINDTEMELESGNYHDMIALPQAIFDAVQGFVKEEDKVKVAKQICKCFNNF